MREKFSLRWACAVSLIASLALVGGMALAAKEAEKGGLSVLFVVDCSGSMKEDNKLEDAKRAARDAINRLEGKFEIAVIAFFDCGNIKVVQGFSSNKQSAVSAISGLSPDSATPLADALTYARGYLMGNAKHENKSMIVLSDGQETCGGNPGESFPAPSGRDEKKTPEDKDEEQEYPSGII